MASKSLRTAVITGANRGIGYYIAEGLAKVLPDFRIIITSRDKTRAEEAAAKIIANNPSAKDRILGFACDISDYATVTQLKDYIKENFGSIDILVNNAGVLSWEDLDAKDTEWVVTTNVLGTINITEELIPLLNPKGKIINLGSSAGSWGKFARVNKETCARLLDEKNTVEDLKSLANEFIKDVKEGNYAGKWCTQRSGYCFSKLMINIYSRNLSFRQDIKDKEIQVYSVCPGWCRTDMGGSDAKKSAEEGADTVVFLAGLLPFKVDEKYQGKFVRDREPAEWEFSPYPHDEPVYN